MTSTSLSTAQAIEDFFDSEDITEATAATYRTYLNKLQKAFPAELPTKPGPLEQHIKSIEGSPEHRHGSFRVIRALYNFLEKRHRLPVDPQWGVQNPVKQITAPRVPKKLPASLNADEFIRLFAATENDQERALVELCADCGLRGGEIASLQTENIDEDFIRVKGKTGERQVSISPEVRDTLLAIAPKKGFIFTDSFGQPATVDSLYNLVKKLLKRAGIQKRHMGTHLLRHSFGRNSLVLGADLRTIQRQMGHSSVKTTEKYTELAQEEVHTIHQKSSPARQLFLINNNDKESKGEPDPGK